MTEIECPDTVITIQSINHIATTLIADSTMGKVESVQYWAFQDEFLEITAVSLSHGTASDIQGCKCTHIRQQAR